LLKQAMVGISPWLKAPNVGLVVTIDTLLVLTRNYDGLAKIGCRSGPATTSGTSLANVSCTLQTGRYYGNCK